MGEGGFTRSQVALERRYEVSFSIARRFKPVVVLGVVLGWSGSVLAVFGAPRLDILTWWHLPFLVPLLVAFVYLLVLVFGSVVTARRALAVRRKPSIVAAWDARESRLI